MINTLPKSLIESAKLVLESGNTHIDVDGELKHRYNSVGNLIHHTDDGIKNFHRWFGDSKVVDDQGRPKVVYHGTGTDITEFKQSSRGTYGGGTYLTADVKGANDYATYRSGPSSTVYPLYVSLKNPAKGSEAAHVASWRGEENAREELLRRGYDGVIDPYGGEIVAFHSHQIKSAVGNNGTFDQLKKTIHESIDVVNSLVILTNK